MIFYQVVVRILFAVTQVVSFRVLDVIPVYLHLTTVVSDLYQMTDGGRSSLLLQSSVIDRVKTKPDPTKKPLGTKSSQTDDEDKNWIDHLPVDAIGPLGF